MRGAARKAALCAALVPLGPAAQLTPAPARQSGELYVRAAEIHIGDGRVLEDGVLYVQDGVLRSVGRGVEVPEGRPVIDHDGVVTAGLISCRAELGASGEAWEPTRALLAEARMADAWSPDHPDFADVLERGVTTVVLAPSERNVAGGITCVVKTDGSEMLEREAHLALSFASSALLQTREPTSYPGAIALLEAELAEPEGPYARAASGRLGALLFANSRHEAARAARFAERHELTGAVAGAAWTGELAQDLADAGLGAVVGPFGPGESPRATDSVLALAEAQVPFAFASPDPDTGLDLRFTAAMCVRAGLDPAVALGALTRDAARIAGVEERVGTLENGKDADFVLWTGDPLDLRSRPVAVFVGGRLVSGSDS